MPSLLFSFFIIILIINFQTTMTTSNEQKWQEKYSALKDYINVHHQLPDKKKVENRGLLNWWKYNKKIAKSGKLSEERTRLLQELSDMRIIKQKPIAQTK